MNLENALKEISDAIDSRDEWLIARASGKSFPVQKREIEISIEHGKIICGFLDEKGFQSWRVAGYRIEKENLTLELTGNFGRAREKVRFTPRVSVAELNQAIELARLEKANRIAALIVKENPASKLVRVALNEANGRFARIIFADRNKKQIAALADVADCAAPETLLTNAIFWLIELQKRRKNPCEKIWILAEKKIYQKLRKLHALLDAKWKRKIRVKVISIDAPNARIASKEDLEIGDLYVEKSSKIALPENSETSRTAAEIVKLAPDAIDSLRVRHGETLRFRGLPFARVRKIGEREKAWFGATRERRILNDATRGEFFDLLENLQIHRRFDAANKRHDFYRLAPEAWLESVLRRDIKRLDANLILSPIYNQFRAGRDRIDLLALRRDGRVVVIELKTAPDREMIFQAIDYWRKIEAQRRAKNLQKARIFGDLEIADRPAIVYLVAPTLSFHRDFEFLAQTVAPEIEIYKFEINENWRENLKVMKVSELKNEN